MRQLGKTQQESVNPQKMPMVQGFCLPVLPALLLGGSSRNLSSCTLPSRTGDKPPVGSWCHQAGPKPCDQQHLISNQCSGQEPAPGSCSSHRSSPAPAGTSRLPWNPSSCRWLGCWTRESSSDPGVRANANAAFAISIGP